MTAEAGRTAQRYLEQNTERDRMGSEHSRALPPCRKVSQTGTALSQHHLHLPEQAAFLPGGKTDKRERWKG